MYRRSFSEAKRLCNKRLEQTRRPHRLACAEEREEHVQGAYEPECMAFPGHYSAKMDKDIAGPEF